MGHPRFHFGAAAKGATRQLGYQELSDWLAAGGAELGDDFLRGGAGAIELVGGE